MVKSSQCVHCKRHQEELISKKSLNFENSGELWRTLEYSGVLKVQRFFADALPKEEAHKKWEGAIKTWLELRVELKKQGQYMKEAGNKPHLHDFLQANAPYHLKTTHLLHFPNPTV